MKIYDVVFSGEFSRAACKLDRDKARSCIKEFEELQEVQRMPDGEEKRALLDAVDEDIAQFAHDPDKTEAMIKSFETQKVKAECRLKLQEAFEAFNVALEANKAANDAVE